MKLKRYIDIFRQYRNKRQLLIRLLLYAAGFKQIRGHWLYVKELRKGSTVLDFGANEGSFSIIMAQVYGSECHLFEPNKKLLYAINLPSQYLHNIAVTAKDGLVDFNISVNSEASSITSDFQNSWDYIEQVSVEGKSFESIIKYLNLEKSTVDIVKVDIEGSEIEFIASLNKGHLDNVNQISIEFHDWLNSDLYVPTKEAINKLVSLGFRTFTDAKSHSEVIEMLFVNMEKVKFSFKQKVLLKLYEKVKYLPN